jgi:ABC-type Zn uptake system ZnuABC Zn-binding protein ZnuA
LDPANAETYRANAAAYIAELTALDEWIEEQVAQVPPERRKLVTDHEVFGYFAQRYGFEQVGAVISGVSTLAEPSAQEMAALQERIGELDVPAIFVGTTVNPTLAESVARDTGTQIVELYTGSLSDAGGPAPTYIEYMRYNVSRIVEALS